MEHYSMVAPSARNVSRAFFCSSIHSKDSCSDFCWHPLWSITMVQNPAGCKAKFMNLTASRRNQQEKKARRPMPVSVHLAAEQLLDVPTHARIVAIDKSLETEDGHKKVQVGDSSENMNVFSDIPAAVSELKAFHADSIRSKLVWKLSEANQYGRNLQRKVKETNETLSKCKSELATMEVELEMLVKLAQDIARDGGKSLEKKVNGRYISSHLASRLEDLHKRILSQIKDVDAMSLRDVPLKWYGMAESVQVMGSFDGWTQGKDMSPENTIAHTLFTTTLNLRPGQYEIKFVVDGIWQLSPELPSVGEGTTINNLLIVD